MNTPCLHTQWPKMRVCRGSPGERGGSLGPGSRGSAGVEGAHAPAISGGMNLCTWTLICQAPGVAHPLSAPGLMLFKWPQARCPFEEKRRICYANDSMVEYNRCDWLIIGRAERCGKPCVNRLCGLHRSRLWRKPGSELHPCRWCGKGTQGETRLCSKECGADRGQKALHRVEARPKRIYPTVMHELLCMAGHQRTLPFIGLRQ